MTQEGLDVGEEERDGSREEPGSPMRATERQTSPLEEHFSSFNYQSKFISL